ncbi:MAG: hypothetical protein GY731_15455 [Gammaproteobacteria bacterium]|nr:hypothetical protein [Gammaproteobacteria bacterium]
MNTQVIDSSEVITTTDLINTLIRFAPGQFDVNHLYIEGEGPARVLVEVTLPDGGKTNNISLRVAP